MRDNEMAYYNLTHPQKRIWYIDRINLNSQLHNIGGSLQINEAIDVEIMMQTLNILIKRNEGIRLRFTEIDAEPSQYIYNFQEQSIDFKDFSKHKKPKEKYKKWSENLFKKNFILQNTQLYYFAIYKLSEKEYGVLLKIHHIISDGWSISLIEKQICEIYNNLIKNEEVYNDKYFSYIDFIKEEKQYLGSAKFIKNKNFWKEKFNEIPKEFLYKASDNLEGKRDSFNIDSDLSYKIKKFINTKKFSTNTFFIAILLIYINKITYKKDLVIGTPVFNRINKKQKGMVGMFTSTVPFRFKIDPELDFESLIELINRELKLCFFNQKYPYDLLVNDLKLSKTGYNSLFKMSINYYNSNYENNINGTDVEVEEYYCGNQSYSLQLTVKEWEKHNITLNFDYKVVEYTEKEIKMMNESMINIINQILIKKNIKINEIKLLNEEEIKNKIYKHNSTNSLYPQKTVCELFEEEALRTPDKVIVEFKENKLTYREINEMSNKLANYLRKLGVKNESVVGIMETHSINLIISILGVLKAGGTYLPIDTNYPIKRINYMLEDSGSEILITNLKVNDDIKFIGNIINIENIDLELYSKENLIKINNLNDLVYIIYTSGSTGKPKGVMIRQQGLTNYVWWAKKMYLKNEEEVMALYSSISFDLTITSIFVPLISGNKVLIYENDDNKFILYKILKENKVTVIKLTPAHLTLLKDMDNSNSNIERLIVGGENLKVSLAKEIYNSFGKNIEIYNEYGPTETVVGCMIYKYDKEKDNGISVPIGYPADNVQIYILDNNLNAIPIGTVGELYISGDGVAKGYLNKKKLTNEKFIENPFIKGKRMYKTGDMARYLENGQIEYVGRRDKQVKIRGHRIELGEIEGYLLEHEFIKESVVIYKKNKLLNAYIVCKREITNIELEKWLLKFLPKYMIPNNFIFMEQLPLTLNGKINHSLLPEPVNNTENFIKYSTHIEKELIIAMKEILGVKTISMKDNYYQLGGDSIKAIQISSKLKNIGLDIKVKDILNCNFIEEIAASIQVNKSNRTINQDESQGDINNTSIIKWFFSQKFENENLYNQYILLECEESLDIYKVSRAISKLVQHHDSLRINYDKSKNKLYYNNGHLNEEVPLKYFDLSQYCDYNQNKNIKILIEKANISFNIEKSLLFNVAIFKLGEERQALLFTAHHLIVDGVSWRIILNDFITIMKQLRNNEEIKLPVKTNSFRDWSQDLEVYRKKDFHEEKAYWNSILDKKNNYYVDFDKDKDSVKTSSTLKYELDENITNDLIKKVNEIYNIEFNETLIIALVLTINTINKKADVVIELEGHGREMINDYIDISRTVGWFTSIYPAYFRIENKELDNSIKSIKEQLRKVPNKGFNYSIIKFLNNVIKESDNKNIRFNYLGDFDNIINKDELNISNIDFGLDSDRKNLLTALMNIEAMIMNKKLKISINYSNNRFESATIQKFMECYIETLKLILDHCINKLFKEFTPSDFDNVDISQEDLDNIFA